MGTRQHCRDNEAMFSKFSCLWSFITLSRCREGKNWLFSKFKREDEGKGKFRDLSPLIEIKKIRNAIEKFCFYALCIESSRFFFTFSFIHFCEPLKSHGGSAGIFMREKLLLTSPYTFWKKEETKLPPRFLISVKFSRGSQFNQFQVVVLSWLAVQF